MNLPKKIAELCWHYNVWNDRGGHRPWYYAGRKRGPKALALHLKISEDEIRDIMKSDEYLAGVENLIRTRRAPEDLKKWIETYKNMPSRFGKRMGLSPEVVSELIKRVLDSLNNPEG